MRKSGLLTAVIDMITSALTLISIVLVILMLFGHVEKAHANGAVIALGAVANAQRNTDDCGRIVNSDGSISYGTQDGQKYISPEVCGAMRAEKKQTFAHQIAKAFGTFLIFAAVSLVCIVLFALIV